MSDEIKAAAQAVRQDKNKDAQIASMHAEIAALRQQLEAKKRGENVLILERHGNDLWFGVRHEYDTDGVITKVAERPDTFKITVRPKRPVASEREALEAMAAGIVPSAIAVA